MTNKDRDNDAEMDDDSWQRKQWAAAQGPEGVSKTRSTTPADKVVNDKEKQDASLIAENNIGWWHDHWMHGF